MSLVKSRPLKTIDDYLSLPPDVRAELIDGELYMTPTPTSRHQKIVSNVTLVLHNYVHPRKLGEVLFSPLDIRLRGGSIVQPDVIYVAQERISIIQDRVQGAPDLCVEVVSQTGAERDRSVKRRLYADNGVQEYWIVDDASRSVEVFTLAGQEYVPFGYFLATEENDDQVTSSVLPDFACSCAAFFKAIGEVSES